MRGEVIAAAIHLHRLEGEDETANTETVAATQGLHDAVVIGFARREQRIVVAEGNRWPLRHRVDRGAPSAHRAAGHRRRRAIAPGSVAGRAPRSRGRTFVLVKPIVARLGLKSLKRSAEAGPTAGIATRSIARTAALDFLPLTWGALRPCISPTRLFSARAANVAEVYLLGRFPRASG